MGKDKMSRKMKSLDQDHSLDQTYWLVLGGAGSV